jgi:predicted nuclease of predicted toxin-antitoxin system
LPNRERTGDQYIRYIASDEGRIVVTKDSDFQDSYLLSKQPPRLLLLTTGNIKNRQLLDLFRQNMDAIHDLFKRHTYIELSNNEIVVHE